MSLGSSCICNISRYEGLDERGHEIPEPPQLQLRPGLHFSRERLGYLQRDPLVTRIGFLHDWRRPGMLGVDGTGTLGLLGLLSGTGIAV